MGVMRRLLFVAVLAVLAMGATSFAAEQTIPPGTIITMRNWQQYTAFMPDGMKDLFAGKYFWKMPPDFQMVVGPFHDFPPPKEYIEDTKKYAGHVQIINFPDGRHSIKGYVAGLPFPNPQAPQKGYKILVDEWYFYFPHILCGPIVSRLLDRFGNRYDVTALLVLRRHSYVSDYKTPVDDPSFPGVYTTYYLGLIAPEQAKYLAQLTVYYTDPAKLNDLFMFIPALRRTLRLSTGARCAPWAGTDWIQDDTRLGGWNGGITNVEVKFLRMQNILSFVYAPDPKVWADWDNFYPRLFLPKPIVGKWEVRPVYVIDVRRDPAMQKNYCLGKRIQYLDKETFVPLWNDLYDKQMKLWKMLPYLSPAVPIPHEGVQINSQNMITGIYDVQNDHLTWSITNMNGQYVKGNEDCRNHMGRDFTTSLYDTVSGLSEIMR